MNKKKRIFVSCLENGKKILNQFIVYLIEWLKKVNTENGIKMKEKKSRMVQLMWVNQIKHWEFLFCFFLLIFLKTD